MYWFLYRGIVWCTDALFTSEILMCTSLTVSRSVYTEWQDDLADSRIMSAGREQKGAGWRLCGSSKGSSSFSISIDSTAICGDTRKSLHTPERLSTVPNRPTATSQHTAYSCCIHQFLNTAAVYIMLRSSGNGILCKPDTDFLPSLLWAAVGTSRHY